MSKAAAIALASVLLFAAAPSGAWQGHGGGHFHGSHQTRVVVGVGPAFWWGPGFWYGPPWYGPPYAYAPPAVILEQPPVYVERPPADGFWYYCESAKSYYPTVSTCPEPWVKVAPRSS